MKVFANEDVEEMLTKGKIYEVSPAILPKDLSSHRHADIIMFIFWCDSGYWAMLDASYFALTK